MASAPFQCAAFASGLNRISGRARATFAVGLPLIDPVSQEFSNLDQRNLGVIVLGAVAREIIPWDEPETLP
jgi:hypothetical protein